MHEEISFWQASYTAIKAMFSLISTKINLIGGLSQQFRKEVKKMKLRRLILMTGSTVFIFFGPFTTPENVVLQEPPAVVREIGDVIRRGDYNTAWNLCRQFQISLKTTTANSASSWNIPLRIGTGTALAHDNDW